MWARHVDDRLTEYLDGRLSAAEVKAFDAHIASCERCRAALADVRFAAGALQTLRVAQAPDSLWDAIDRAAPMAAPVPRGSWFHVDTRRLVQVAALLALTITGALIYRLSTHHTPGVLDPQNPFHIARLGDGRTLPVPTGDWMETRAGEALRLRIGAIGTVDVEPGSRVRIVRSAPAEYRLALARGGLSAVIDAPPRIFIVETPASTVVDLGCAYTMHVDDEGHGVIRVTSGWIALELDDLESLVPAGASAATRARVGPGTPVFDDAPEPLKRAIAQFDAGSDRQRALDVVLRDARVRDTLTLWHLVSRVTGEERARVADRIIALTPLPKTLDRGTLLRLDREAMRLWREELVWEW